MGAGAGTAGFGAGLARGLASILVQRRQDDQAATQRQEQRHTQTLLGLLPTIIERAQSYDDVQPFIEQIIQGAGGAPTGGKKGKRASGSAAGGALDPHAILSQVLAPALGAGATGAATGAGGPPSPAASSPGAGTPPRASAAPATDPFFQPPVASTGQDPAPGGGGAPTTTPAAPASPARQSLMGVPLLNDEELATRATNRQAASEQALAERRVGIARDLYQRLKDVDPDFTLRDAMRAAGFTLDTERMFAPRPIGDPVESTAVPGEAVDEQGQAIDPTQATHWQAIQGPRGQIYWIPGASTSGDVNWQRMEGIAAGETTPRFFLQHPRTLEIRDLSGQPVAGDVRPVPPQGAAPSFQSKDVLDDQGVPVAANFDARTGRYTKIDGTVIQNPRPIPSAAATQDARKFKQAGPILDSIAELSARINTQQGVVARMAGGTAKIAAQANLNDDVAEYQALIMGFTPLVARALGHTGVLTQQDVDSVRALFPTAGDSKTLRDRKIARIQTILTALETDAAPAGTSTETPATAQPSTPRDEGASDANRRLRARQYLLQQGKPATDANINWLLQQPNIDTLLPPGRQ